MAMKKLKCPHCGRMVAVTNRTVTAKKPYIETRFKPHIINNKRSCPFGGMTYHVIEQENNEQRT